MRLIAHGEQGNSVYPASMQALAGPFRNSGFTRFLGPTSCVFDTEVLSSYTIQISTGTFGELMQANKALLTDPGLMSSEVKGLVMGLF